MQLSFMRSALVSGRKLLSRTAIHEKSPSPAFAEPHRRMFMFLAGSATEKCKVEGYGHRHRYDIGSMAVRRNRELCRILLCVVLSDNTRDDEVLDLCSTCRIETTKSVS